MTHTPGPWKYHPGTCITTDERDPQTIAYLSDHRNRKPRPEAESISNGLVIAAAPELLRAAKALSEEAHYDGIEPEFTIDPQTLAELDAAIAQAEGGAQ